MKDLCEYRIEKDRTFLILQEFRPIKVKANGRILCMEPVRDGDRCLIRIVTGDIDVIVTVAHDEKCGKPKWETFPTKATILKPDKMA